MSWCLWIYLSIQISHFELITNLQILLLLLIDVILDLLNIFSLQILLIFLYLNLNVVVIIILNHKVLFKYKYLVIRGLLLLLLLLALRRSYLIILQFVIHIHNLISLEDIGDLDILDILRTLTHIELFISTPLSLLFLLLHFLPI